MESKQLGMCLNRGTLPSFSKHASDFVDPSCHGGLVRMSLTIQHWASLFGLVGPLLDNMFRERSLWGQRYLGRRLLCPGDRHQALLLLARWGCVWVSVRQGFASFASAMFVPRVAPRA